MIKGKKGIFLIVLLACFLLGCTAGPENDMPSSGIDQEETGGDTVNTEELKFYPEHPSGSKTNQIETTAMQLLEQEAPFEAWTLYMEFLQNADAFFGKYVDKRFEIRGIAKKVGPDIHNKPSIEISDAVNGQTYALVIFPTDEHYSRVKVGDTVVVRANYLVMSNHYGTVMKFSELVSVEKAPEQNGADDLKLSAF